MITLQHLLALILGGDVGKFGLRKDERNFPKAGRKIFRERAFGK